MAWEQRRAKCFTYLDRFKEQLTPFQYKSIRQTIGTLALEDMFVSLEKIDRLIEIAQGKVSANDSVSQLKKRLDSVA